MTLIYTSFDLVDLFQDMGLYVIHAFRLDDGMIYRKWTQDSLKQTKTFLDFKRIYGNFRPGDDKWKL